MSERFSSPAGRAAAYRPVYITPRTFRAGQRGHLHAHDCAEAFFITQGRGECVVRNAHVPVCAGDCILVNPSVEHAEIAGADGPMAYTVIGLADTQWRLANSSAGYAHASFGAQWERVSVLLAALNDEAQDGGEDAQAVCASLLHLLLTYAGRAAGLDMRGGAQTEMPRGGAHRMTWVKQYLDDNFAREITLEALEARVNLNRCSIVRLFRKHYGVSPMQYVLRRRLEEAKFNLTTSDVSVRQIAALCGFTSANYFSQTFQKHEGVSPTAYRQTHRQGADER